MSGIADFGLRAGSGAEDDADGTRQRFLDKLGMTEGGRAAGGYTRRIVVDKMISCMHSSG
jgi:hypothetical protein